MGCTYIFGDIFIGGVFFPTGFVLGGKILFNDSTSRWQLSTVITFPMRLSNVRGTRECRSDISKGSVLDRIPLAVEAGQ